MKKNVLSIVVLLVSALCSLSAQTDKTPDKFKFSKLPLGACPNLIEEGYAGANPAANYAAASTTTGYIMQGGAAAYYPASTPVVKSALSVVSGGNLGNILMIKGKDSKETRGVAASDAIPGWWNLCFYVPNNIEYGTYRFTVKMRIISEDASLVDPIKIILQGFAGGGLSAETEAFYLNDQGWWQYEVDTNAPLGAANIPARLKMSFVAGTMDKIAILMQDIKITLNPTGTPQIVQLPDNDSPNSNISGLSLEKSPVYAQGGNIIVENEAGSPVEIFSVSGALLKSLKGTDKMEIPMSKGLYLVRMGNETFKVAL